MERKEYQYFSIAYIAGFFCFGLFYEFASCIFCGLYGFLYFSMSLRKKDLKFYCNPGSIGITVIAMCYLLTVLYGIDAGSSFIGGIRLLGVFFFMLCAMQMTLEQRDRLLEQTAMTGSLMVWFGVAAVFVPPIQSYFYTARRLGGFFQYANVFALFCLLGIIVMGEGKFQIVKGNLKIAHIISLMLGIFLSGSRTVFLLLFAICVIQGIRSRKTGKTYLILFGIMLLLAAIYVLASKDLQNVGRFLTASFTSSTFLGRILYVKDGLQILCHHPFGLGYMGYYFLEPIYQTGVYTIRFVHNDVLQLALDIGIVPSMLFVFMLLCSLFGRGNTEKNRLMAGVISIHCLVDFDLEFISIWMLLVLVLDVYKGKEINISVGGRRAFYKWMAGIVSAGALYAGIAMLPFKVGNSGLTVKLLPFYTEAQVVYLSELSDMEEAEMLAKKMSLKNKYLPAVYDVLAAAAYGRNDFIKMAEYKRQSVLSQKYNTEVYERYVLLLGRGIIQAHERGDLRTAAELKGYALEIREILADVAKSTDKLAWEIRDKPELKLSRVTEEYLKWMIEW